MSSSSSSLPSPDSFVNLAGGPPDPINYLRSAPALLRNSMRYDTDDEGPVIHHDDDKDSDKQRNKRTRLQLEEDPPARERPTDGAAWPYRETLSFTRSLVFYGAGSITSESEVACQHIQAARYLRQQYFGGTGTLVKKDAAQLQDDALQFQMKGGVVQLLWQNESLVQVPSIVDFCKDYANLVTWVSEGAMRSFCFQRLQILSTSYKMHTTLNSTIEMEEQSNLLGTDFYRTMKIDNHIHAAAAPSAKQFVHFVRTKLQNEGDTAVNADGTTLRQVYQDAGLDMDHLTIDAFNVLADYSVYQRFDNFNDKISPFRLADMRRIFLKTNNHMQGRYFAELLKIVLQRHEMSKGHNSACELRLSIYGMERHEWYDLACWMMHDWPATEDTKGGNMVSPNNRWLIQIPRLWRIYSRKPVQEGEPPRSFQDMLDNIFIPMFEATLHPDKHPEIAQCLQHIVGFDSVDDEGVLETHCGPIEPEHWTDSKTPCYQWQLYYIWANLHVLNRLRQARGLNTIAFRPHAGETGDSMHLAASYMLCDSINHGILLDSQVSLQYLYYLDQVGLSISPLSNNFLFRKMADNPFSKFFRRGLNVTLSTDDPLLFHMSDDALLEEYSVARATFDLSMTDMMEVARNSVLQSGFEREFKKQWLGPDFEKGLTFCDEHITHVPLIRAKFRAEHLALEHMLVHLIAAGKGNRVLQEMKVQFGLARDAHRDVLFENFDEVPAFPEQNQL
ncbi:AMP deaminase [Fistulifera solaris]|uniref:AMP deaminase n=1 Tax=Fistulifera solaris TaxID=1519565 RepID=A0A1Z5K1L3_FISSO|nr:AMP deaminase [Fistulifera solaris]|eukprot:GAX20170.1 AMP deaminase [Fistulifera solaris]